MKNIRIWIKDHWHRVLLYGVIGVLVTFIGCNLIHSNTESLVLAKQGIETLKDSTNSLSTTAKTTIENTVNNAKSNSQVFDLLWILLVAFGFAIACTFTAHLNQYLYTKINYSNINDDKEYDPAMLRTVYICTMIIFAVALWKVV